jgi:hypothetical protein
MALTLFYFQERNVGICKVFNDVLERKFVTLGKNMTENSPDKLTFEVVIYQ